MPKVVRAIDAGFRYTKFVTHVNDAGIHCRHFLSRTYPSRRDMTEDPLGGRRDTVAIPINRIYYEVGPEVELAADAAVPSILPDCFVRTDPYLAFIRGALHYMQVPNIDVLVLWGCRWRLFKPTMPP